MENNSEKRNLLHVMGHNFARNAKNAKNAKNKKILKK